MKNVLKIIGIVALVSMIGLSAMSCVTASTIGGTADMHGLFSGNKAGALVTEGATEIASYKVILGFADSGYAEYDAAVKAAVASGKQVFTTTKFLFVMTKTTAYAK